MLNLFGAGKATRGSDALNPDMVRAMSNAQRGMPGSARTCTEDDDNRYENLTQNGRAFGVSETSSEHPTQR